MSSAMKDARWGLANFLAGSIGLEFDDLSYDAWQKVLDSAQDALDKNPIEVTYWAKEFRGE